MANKSVFIFLLVPVALLSWFLGPLTQSQFRDFVPVALHSWFLAPFTQSQFTNFMFVQTWPPSYCESNTCAQHPERFTIHGLWPLKTKKAGKDQLTDAILDARKTKLLQFWPDLKTTRFKPSKKFWHYEYNKHGVYCTTKYSAEEYLVKALSMGEAFKTRAWLAKKNIVPDASKQYTTSDVVAAIKSQTSVTPDLQCYNKGGKSYLLEIRLCLDDSLEKFINCGGKVGQCSGQVYYNSSSSSEGITSEEVLEVTEDLLNSVEVV